MAGDAAVSPQRSTVEMGVGSSAPRGVGNSAHDLEVSPSVSPAPVHEQTVFEDFGEDVDEAVAPKVLPDVRAPTAEEVVDPGRELGPRPKKVCQFIDPSTLEAYTDPIAFPLEWWDGTIEEKEQMRDAFVRHFVIHMKTNNVDGYHFNHYHAMALMQENLPPPKIEKY